MIRTLKISFALEEVGLWGEEILVSHHCNIQYHHHHIQYILVGALTNSFSGRTRGHGRGGGQVGGRGRAGASADNQGEGRSRARGRTCARRRGRAVGRGNQRQRGGSGGGRGGAKYRRWSFTINNYTSVPTSLPKNVDYLCYGKEVGKEKGTPHLQGFVVFKNRMWQPHKTFLEHGYGHFEPTMGTVQDNIDYCSKDGDFTEFGRRPQDRHQQGHHGARGGEMEIVRWEEAWKAAKEGRIEDIPADIRSRYLNTWLRVKSMNLPKPEELDSLENLWIVGPSGSGKSLWVHRTFPGAYKKGFNKWWCGYDSGDPEHDVVVLDDLHPSWSDAVHLKNWGDHYPFMAEYKGGSTVIRPSKIIVTSNYHPAQVFKEVDLGPILRRFRVVSVADLPPAPPKQKRGAESGAVEDINLEDIDESEFDPQAQQELQQQNGDEGVQDGGQQQQEGVPVQQNRGLSNEADDSELDPAVQQVLEIQLQAGQEQEQLNTQEFQERFFLNI